MRIKRLLCGFLAALTVCLTVLPIGTFAAELTIPMDETDVLEDLQKKNYILSRFPKDAGAEFVSLLDVDEYAYDANGDFRYYGIYLYLYNPTGRAIDPATLNVQMSYIQNGSVLKPYQKYPVEIISISGDSDSGDTDGLFYKLKVSGTTTMAREVISNLRTYYFSGIELDLGDGLKDYPLSQRWTFTGYQKNFGLRKDDPENLFENRYSLEVAEVELHPASWFTQTSSSGAEYRWELSSVYFNIPDYYIQQYGNIDDARATSGLRAVRGVYHKGMVNGLLISDQDKYREFVANAAYQNLHCSPNYDAATSTMGGLGFANVNSTKINGNISTQVVNKYEFSFNMIVGEFREGATRFKITSDNILTECYYPMYAQDLSMSQQSFLQHFQADGKYFTSASTLYNKSWNDTQTFGYQPYEVNIDQGSWNTAFRTYASEKHFFLDKLFNKELYADADGYAADCAPIVELNSRSFSGNTATDSQTLYVMNEDVPLIKNFYNEKKNGNHVYLMRFDCTPYYAVDVTLQQSNGFVDITAQDARYFEKIIHAKFDILEFEFENNYGKKEVVAASCTPIDVVGGIVSGDNRVDFNPNEPGDQSRDEAPTDLQALAKKLLIGVAIVGIALLILQMLGFPLQTVFRLISGILLLPLYVMQWLFRLLRRLFAIGKRAKATLSHKRRQKKRPAEAHADRKRTRTRSKQQTNRTQEKKEKQ